MPHTHTHPIQSPALTSSTADLPSFLIGHTDLSTVLQILRGGSCLGACALAFPSVQTFSPHHWLQGLLPHSFRILCSYATFSEISLIPPSFPFYISPQYLSSTYILQCCTVSPYYKVGFTGAGIQSVLVTAVSPW